MTSNSKAFCFLAVLTFLWLSPAPAFAEDASESPIVMSAKIPAISRTKEMKMEITLSNNSNKRVYLGHIGCQMSKHFVVDVDWIKIPMSVVLSCIGTNIDLKPNGSLTLQVKFLLTGKAPKGKNEVTITMIGIAHKGPLATKVSMEVPNK